MTLINVKTSERMPIRDLWRLALKWVYAPDSCGPGTRSRIEQSILNWYDLVKYQKRIALDRFGVIEELDQAIPVGKKGTVVDEIEYQIQALSKLLVDDEEGLLDKRKEFFKQHKVDYRKFILYRIFFPEMNSAKDIAKAKEALRINQEEYPEHYGRDK